MCVIIYIPKNETITKKEIKAAWEMNPDGAGYMIKYNNKTMYKRGFMKFNSYYNNIKHKIGREDLILHFRISTSDSINQTQTHPYKKGNIKRLQGVTDQPVICMNGSIWGQTEYKGYNDTMSYIQDHQEAFKVMNQDILNIIASDTGSKWAVMKQGEVILSNNFTYHDGKYYSNTNHLARRSHNRKYHNYNISDIIPNHLLFEVYQDYRLTDDLEDYIEFVCNQGNCYMCINCLKQVKTIPDIEDIIYNYYDY